MKTSAFFTIIFSFLLVSNNWAAEALKVDISKKDISCFGQKNGSAEVLIKGGNAPYTVKWNTGQSDLLIENLGKGIYTVTVVDVKGDAITKEVEILMPDPISISFQSKEKIFVSSLSADLNITIKGGQPFSSQVEAYNLSLFEQNNPVVMQTNLASGVYKLSVEDANGCKLNFKTNIEVLNNGTESVSLLNKQNGYGVIELTPRSVEVSTLDYSMVKHMK
jgi:hypothetical protein